MYNSSSLQQREQTRSKAQQTGETSAGARIDSKRAESCSQTGATRISVICTSSVAGFLFVCFFCQERSQTLTSSRLRTMDKRVHPNAKRGCGRKCTIDGAPLCRGQLLSTSSHTISTLQEPVDSICRCFERALRK
jgi:hypothetical protein